MRMRSIARLLPPSHSSQVYDSELQFQLEYKRSNQSGERVGKFRLGVA